MFLGWPFSKTVREILIHQETWLWWMGPTCTIGQWRNSLKFFFSEMAGKIFENFHRDIPWGPFSKTVHESLIRKETLLWWMGATCTIWKWRNSWTFFFSETAGQIWKLFHGNIPWMAFFKMCSRNFDRSRNMALLLNTFSPLLAIFHHFCSFWNCHLPTLWIRKSPIFVIWKRAKRALC